MRLLPGLSHRQIDAVAFYSRHRCHRFGRSFAVDHKHRPDQIGDLQGVFSDMARDHAASRLRRSRVAGKPLVGLKMRSIGLLYQLLPGTEQGREPVKVLQGFARLRQPLRC